MSNEKTTAQAQHALIMGGKFVGEFPKTTHPEAQWFYHPVTLGLFIHWGISTAGDDLDISWSMMDNPARYGRNGMTTPRKYWQLAEKFNPQNYNPEKWLTAAKDAGFTYAVLTTRHHDGFSLWPSDVSDFSTKNYMGGRDLVQEYVDACRKVGLKVGFYYSPPDWRFNQKYMSFAQGSRTEKFPDRAHKDIDHNVIDAIPEMPAEHKEKYIAYVNAQARELLTRYGRVDLLWFDGTTNDLDHTITIDEIRSLQPHIIVNDRMWGFGNGDYCTKYECFLPAEKPPYEYWETCHCWHVGGGWSYVKNADKYRPLEDTLHKYDVCKEFGGNLLLNVAPDGDGNLPDAYYEKVKEFGLALKQKNK